MVEWITGGVTAPEGFVAAGVRCGIKFDKPDLALVLSEQPASVAGCFTRNKITAAPVLICKEYLQQNDTCRAVIVSSGIANACTGQQGLDNARAMTEITAQHLDVKPHQVLVCSTGRIGTQLPMKEIGKGIKQVVGQVSKSGYHDAALAIMTTDTFPKEAAVCITIGDTQISVGGMAKGAGMIEPNMATMLAFVTTDAAVAPAFLQQILREVVDQTFNTITVDGDTSTNDSVIILANGAAGNTVLTADSPGSGAFKDAVKAVCLNLAEQIVKDGEGATKLVSVVVNNAATDTEARRAAKTVANSLLLKVAMHGSDANWGRIMAALGRADLELDPYTIDIDIDDVRIVAGGAEQSDMKKFARKVWKQERFSIVIDLHAGSSSYTCLTCDLSHAYIDINL